jgi:hypothetical protein
MTQLTRSAPIHDMDLISEFFYEIRRFIPGVAIIALYFHREVENEFSAHRDVSIVIPIICILTIAWFLGLALEEIASFAAHIAWRIGADKLFKSAQSSVKLKNPEPPEDTSKFETEQWKNWTGRARVLRFAEREMNRSLFFVFLFAIFVRPERFSVFPWHCSFTYLGCAIFLFSWLSPRHRRRRYDRLKSPALG